MMFLGFLFFSVYFGQSMTSMEKGTLSDELSRGA